MSQPFETLTVPIGEGGLIVCSGAPQCDEEQMLAHALATMPAAFAEAGEINQHFILRTSSPRESVLAITPANLTSDEASGAIRRLCTRFGVTTLLHISEAWVSRCPDPKHLKRAPSEDPNRVEWLMIYYETTRRSSASHVEMWKADIVRSPDNESKPTLGPWSKPRGHAHTFDGHYLVPLKAEVDA